MSDDIIQTIQESLKAGKQITVEQGQTLLQRLELAETLLKSLCPAVTDVEKERDAYVLLSCMQNQTIEELRHRLANALHHAHAHTEHLEPFQIDVSMEWRYNVREFFEVEAHGWRAIVSSDSEDFTWIAYIEQGGVRFYAAQKYILIQDALRWCADEIMRRTPQADDTHQELEHREAKPTQQ